MSSETFYEAVKRSGVSRRDFLRFCATTTAFLGLESTVFPQVVKALDTVKRPPIFWLNYAACSCCSESMIKSSHPLASDALLGVISMDFIETIQAAAGFQAEEIIHNGMKENYGNYILAIEGSVPTADGGIYCTVGGVTAMESLKEAAKGAKAIICVGSCSSFGCVTVAKPNPTGCVPVHKLITDKPVINIPGCPPIPEVIMGTIVHLVTFGTLPVLDRLQRPRVFYGQRIHDKCYRRAFYDAGMFVENFDDEGARKGWCLYKMGCRGPVTYNACAVTKWNDGTSFPIQSGHPCLGCSEPDYWDRQPLYQHVAGTPLPGLSNVDMLGKLFAGGVGAATVAHLAASTIRKATRKQAPEETAGEPQSGKEA
ncbi:MAG: hydrogenase small subunit [Blastocatellia bacterium]|nr:hydrogenase small subunit [Blastocatellia bacterium]